MKEKNLPVIIPSAKIVPDEMQKIGKLPAIIYPVNQRIVFDYLYEQYGDMHYKIVCYEEASAVKQRVLKYKNVKVVELDQLLDLGYSIFSGIKGCSGAGYVNFADTIVLEGNEELPIDSFYYSTNTISKTWTYYKMSDGEFTSILDKKDVGGEETIGNLFVGVFKFSHLEYLYECLKIALDEKPSDMNSFYYSLILYSRKYKITPVKASNWLDIGHQEKYYEAALEVKAREFNHISIDKERGILTKYSDEVDKFIGEIKWYLKLPSDVEYVRPRIFDYSVSYINPYVSMEYYRYHTLHELFLFSDLTGEQWVSIFKRIRFVCHDFKRYSLKEDSLTESLQEMYLTKTVRRLDQLRSDKRFIGFFDNEIVINGKIYQSLNNVIEKLKRYVPELLYDVDEFCIIHGDLCFSNIMVDDQFTFIKVIDPRGKFGKYDIYGDERYEIAKLLHSIDGKYDYIIKDLYEVDIDVEKNKIDYSIIEKEREYDLYKIFLKTFEDIIGQDLKKIELIESLLFLSMIPLHKENVYHQIIMLATGLDILNRVIDISI